MVECDICGKNIDSPFSCNYCGGSFCGEHRLPPNHNCINISAWKSRSGPGLGNQRKGRSWLAGGEKPDLDNTQAQIFSPRWWSKKKAALIIIIIVVIGLVSYSVLI